MRIAFVSTLESAPWGGSEELWSGAARQLAARGVTVGANVWRWSPPPADITSLTNAGVSITMRRVIRRLRYVMGDRLDRFSTRWIEAFRPDLLLISAAYHTDGRIWMEACIRSGVPYALLVQAAGEPFWPEDDDATALARGYESAVAQLFVSPRNRDFVRAQLATPLARSEVVRNPFAVPYGAAPGWPDTGEGFSLALVARLQPMAKGQDLLFAALADRKWRDRPLRVTLYGDGPSRITLQRLRDMLHLECVKFGGVCANIEELWSRHHGLILPSRYEGLPLVIVEAMLCGRICIVTDVGGSAELVRDGVTGFVAPAPTVPAIDATLERAWQRRAEWEAMGALAAADVRNAIPRDPASVLADRLLEVAANSRPG